MIGRSPDHVASTLAGFRMGLAAFRDYDPARAAALDDYFHYARDNDLFLSYVIINPQADKAKSAGEQPDRIWWPRSSMRMPQASPFAAPRCWRPAA